MRTGGKTLSRLIIAALAVAIACAGCPCSEPAGKPHEGGEDEAQGSSVDHSLEFKEYSAHWKGYGTAEELEALKKMNTGELTEFLKNLRREPALRVEALRLLTERAEDKKKIFPVLLASLRGPTIREREAALYLFSRFGTPNHIVAIEASIMGVEACPDYSTETNSCIDHSIECTIEQILTRIGEGKK